MSTLGERIDAVRELLDAREVAEPISISRPPVTVTRSMVDMLERQINAHPVLFGRGNPWCRRCLLDWPCQEVRAAEQLLRSVEESERGGTTSGQADHGTGE